MKMAQPNVPGMGGDYMTVFSIRSLSSHLWNKPLWATEGLSALLSVLWCQADQTEKQRVTVGTV